MPMVGNKKFAYNESGRKLAQKYAAKLQQRPTKATRPAGSVRPVVQGERNTTLPSLNERRKGKLQQAMRRRFM